MSDSRRWVVGGARWLWLPLAGAFLGAWPQVIQGQRASAPLPEDGKLLFETRCVVCHTIGGGDRIGPDLEGVAERRDVAWLRRFIRDPDELFKEQDSIALASLARFGVPMPTLGLTEPQVEAVVVYLTAAETAPAARPALLIPTLITGVLAIVGLTVLGLSAGAKRVEVRS